MEVGDCLIQGRITLPLAPHRAMLFLHIHFQSSNVWDPSAPSLCSDKHNNFIKGIVAKKLINNQMIKEIVGDSFFVSLCRVDLAQNMGHSCFKGRRHDGNWYGTAQPLWSWSGIAHRFDAQRCHFSPEACPSPNASLGNVCKNLRPFKENWMFLLFDSFPLSEKYLNENWEPSLQEGIFV